MSIDFYEQYDRLCSPLSRTSPEGVLNLFSLLSKSVPSGEPTGCRIPKDVFAAALRWTGWANEGQPSPEHMTARLMRQELLQREGQQNLRIPFVWMNAMCEALEPIVAERATSDPEAGILPQHRKRK